MTSEFGLFEEIFSIRGHSARRKNGQQLTVDATLYSGCVGSRRTVYVQSDVAKILFVEHQIFLEICDVSKEIWQCMRAHRASLLKAAVQWLSHQGIF